MPGPAEQMSDEMITSEVDLFTPSMVQSVLYSEFEREVHPIAAITQGSPIEFHLKGADQLYLDLDQSLLYIRVKITNADGTNIAANTAGPANLTLHSLFTEMSAKLNHKIVSEPSQMYPYRAYLETLLNYSEETQKTRLLTEGWVKDTTGEMGVTDVRGANAGLVTRTTRFATSTVVELIGRPRIDIFQQGRLIPPGVDLHLTLVPSKAAFVCKSAAPAANAQQEQFKAVIEHAGLRVRFKQLSDSMELAHKKKVADMNYLFPLSRVKAKHLHIANGVVTQDFGNVFLGRLPDLVIVGLVADEDFGGRYQGNPFNFQNFNLSSIELRVNGTSKPRDAYTPNFGNGQYIKDYMTFQKELGFDVIDKCVSLTPSEWANGYTIYAFKITEGPIGNGTEGPRSRAESGEISLHTTFRAATGTNIKVIILSVEYGVLEIDQFKNPTLS